MDPDLPYTQRQLSIYVVNEYGNPTDFCSFTTSTFQFTFTWKRTNILVGGEGGNGLGIGIGGAKRLRKVFRDNIQVLQSPLLGALLVVEVLNVSQPVGYRLIFNMILA